MNELKDIGKVAQKLIKKVSLPTLRKDVRQGKYCIRGV